ncbi:alkaline phosphatase family protein [Brevibacillus humidisoli]|uniref:alkaline phosphatase family protein n=1 Tax=Brevibacillus humidisoli TaxID=2895522 RepID=UPI001E57CAB0|nr:alkaline phosphatase family protein [Brevibacillus humidisoli]UFJ43120.1 alkaline phosphatase family protein [Brevibacillus humidisoli]
MKKVLLFLIDSMMTDVLLNCIQKGKTPALQFFHRNGQLIPDCVTVFPTMTASIDCSLITGEYPDRHKVPGLVWYDPSEQKIVNYINGAEPVLTIGLAQCARNVVFDMNDRHLSSEVQTVHEELEEKGFTSGSINVIAHRGRKRYNVHPPFLLDAAAGFSLEGTTSGPTIFSMGTLVKPAIFREVPWSMSQSPAGSLGINDVYAIDVLIEVVRSGMQPDFTLIYLPDNDHKVHKSPRLAEDHLAQVDKQLVRFLDTFDTWEQALERNVFILVSDHGQTVVGSTEEHNVNLDQLLEGYATHQLQSTNIQGDELVICNNERMAYLYPLRDDLLFQVIETLSGEGRIDLIAWKEGEWAKVMNRGELLSFRRGGTLRDQYGTAWTVEGEWKVLDLYQDESGVIGFDSYPDALSRLYGALFSQDVPVIIITAAPGYEFLSKHMPTHLGGGSHGSLHKQDSLIPLLIAGTNRPFVQPARLVDIKSYVIQEVTTQAALV